MTPLVYTQSEVATLLRVTTRMVRQLTRSGQLRATYVGRLPRYLPSDVEAYLRARRQRGISGVMASMGSRSRTTSWATTLVPSERRPAM